MHRLVRGEDRKLNLSGAVRDYNPGRGDYRSPYKNALRLTRTDTKITCGSSDFEWWQKIPFIVGIEIRLSNAHKIYGICDKLVGKYPKEFKFTGWHPQCICNAVDIQMADGEFDKYQNQILSNATINTSYVNTVSKTPAAFDKYVDENSERIKGWKNTPYGVKTIGNIR